MERRITSQVAIDEIVFDEEVYPRSQYNWQTGYDYSQSIKSGAKFPPITLALLNNRKILVDGKHRLEAFKSLKIKKISAEVFTGWSKRKIFEEAIRRNIAHGRSLSPYEKRLVALKLRQMKYTKGQISQLIQIPMDKLDNFTAQRMSWSTTGEPIVVKTEIKNIAGQTVGESSQIEEWQKPMYQNNQLSLIDNLILLIEKNLLDTQDKRIMARLKHLKKLL